MQPKPTDNATSGFGLGDIFFLLFRHKGKIALGLLLGVIGAAAVFLTGSRTYVSEAKILVRYVADRTSITPASAGENVRSTDPQGGSILNSEIQIITSRDLAEDVARLATAETILATPAAGPLDAFISRLPNAAADALRPKKVLSTNFTDAVNQVQNSVKAEVVPRTSVIAIHYEHPDGAVAQQVLTQLIRRYMEKHVEVHRSLGAYEFLQSQTERLKAQLVQTEAELHRLRTNSGYMDVTAAKVSMEKDMAQLRTLIMEEEANLEGRRALSPVSTNSTNTANTAAASTPTNAPVDPGSMRDVGFYKSVCNNLDAQRTQEIQLLSRYKDTHPLLQAVRAQIAELTKRKEQMEAENPQLALLDSSRTSRDGTPSTTPDTSLSVPALQARLKVLRAQYERLRSDAANLDYVAGAIHDVERRKAIEEENYRAFSTSLEKARIDQAVDASKLTSISVVQAASLPGLLPGKRLKPAGMALAGGIAFGLLLALFSEFVLNPTVKHPGEFKRGSLPLMLAIPSLERAGRKFRRRKKANGEVVQIDSLPAVSDPSHPMRPYFEALRDRLLLEFEGNKKKPKLVGVTACSRGAGASSIAAGMAAAMSETGDGNVLLVDLNFEQGSAHQFFKGLPVCALDEATEEGTRDSGLVQENLYLASINQAQATATSNGESHQNGESNAEANGRAVTKTAGNGRLAPSKQIAEMMPKLKASDYDYIIFDMPPINPTSITFRMSGLMDKVLLVVESEETHRDDLNQATALLRQAKAKAEAVLNRHERHMPRFLPQG